MFTSRVEAAETGFKSPTTCTTNGSSCSNMEMQDTNYNSWINASPEEIVTTFTGFDIPEDSIIDDIQIKMKVKTSTNGWLWLVEASTNNGVNYFTPLGCGNGICSYNTTTNFNSINVPNLVFLNTNPNKILTGKDVSSSLFKLRLRESSSNIKSTDVDTLLFNIRYHLGSLPPPLPHNVYQVTRGFELPSPPVVGVGRVLYYIDIQIPYSGGKVVLSSTPDGNGDINVRDSIQINNLTTSQNFIYDAFLPGCIGFKSESSPIDVTSYFSKTANQGKNNVTVRILDRCGGTKNIGPIYLVVIPIAPEPFLDLPWDYEAKGQIFEDAALSMSAYFDHEYPVIGILDEFVETRNTIIHYKGEGRVVDPYSSHNGYDYAKRAKVHIGEDVLAAAEGTAELVTSCGDCGNMIVIDHGNGYETKYMHLLDDSAIVSNPGVKISVAAHQKIGKVGFSGYVFPKGQDGAHIHFGVYQDKNKDGNFSDNVLDGLTDPFGWQSTNSDPWENYTFLQNGVQKTGNKSYYLWKKSLGSTTSNLTSSGGNFTVGHYSLMFPAGSTLQNVKIELKSEPVIPPSISFYPIVPGLSATAKDSAGSEVSNFFVPFNVRIDFSSIDISRIDPNTLSIYSSQDGINWTKEATTLDLMGKKATADINHFTHFALMGERLDTNAPETAVTISGEKGNGNWYRSDVTVTLSAQDNMDGIGVEYTAYKLSDGDIQEYKTPITFSDEGNYKIEFYSEDRDGNIEDIKTLEFNIDKTPPEAGIKVNLDTLEIDIIGYDGFGSATVQISDIPKKKNSIKIIDDAGNTLEIIGKDKDKGKNAKITIESLQYNNDPLINVDPTKLVADYNLDNKSLDLKTLEQRFEIKGELKIKFKYAAKINKTQVITKVKGEEKVKEQLDGIKILKLVTEKGTINYSY